MAKLCERPGCSNPGEAAYGMVAEDLIFWIEPLDRHAPGSANVLCKRHADSMVVPRGWTLDDRRNGGPRLFQPLRFEASSGPAVAAPRRSRPAAIGEQLQIDGTGEITRPQLPPEPADSADSLPPEPVAQVEPSVAAVPSVGAEPEPEPETASEAGPTGSWRPDFATDDDLDGLLNVNSPLLSRAFRGTDLPR